MHHLVMITVVILVCTYKGGTIIMEQKSTFFKKTFFQYIVLNLCVLIILTFTLQLWNANLFKYPLAYTGSDETLSFMYFQTLLEDGLVSNPSRLGVPYISEALDFSDGRYLTLLFR